MARIAKSGLEYFPFDIDFFQDIRIRKLIKRQGGKAVTVYALLLCLIYKNGYYMQWDEELPFIGSELSGFEEAYISEVITVCLTLGLFDKNLFETEHVLTSKGIQLRYCNVQRLNKRMGRIDKYRLLEDAPAKPAAEKVTDKPKPGRKPKQTAAKTQSQPATPESPTPAPAPQVAPQPEPQHTLTAPQRPPVDTSDRNKELLAQFFAENNSESLRLFCKNLGLEPDDVSTLRKLAEAVVNEWALSNAKHYDYSDWSRHLISCMRIKHRDSFSRKPAKPTAKTPPKPSDYTYDGGFGGQDI